MLTGNIRTDAAAVDAALKTDNAFDVVARYMYIGQRRARLYFVDGFCKDEVMEKIMEFLMGAKPDKSIKSTAELIERFVSYVEAEPQRSIDEIVTGVLSGTVAIIADGFDEAIMIDARTYPARSTEEPEDDRVLRGSRDGFVETIVANCALIRRRIKTPDLCMKIQRVGTRSKTDVVVCYIDGIADPALVKKLQKKLSSLKLNTLAMGQESLTEAIVGRQWLNPFPKVRYTERPDTAAASVAEGKILIITDNSPSVMLIPATIFDFVQETNDFSFPPIIGTYLRLVRIIVYLLTLFLIPVWYLLISYPSAVPDWLMFIVPEPSAVPVIVQIIIIEILLDALKLASLNTPASLSNSFSVVGALILGEFALEAGWFVPEVILYMAFVAVANFTQPSFELGWAFKLFRMLLTIASAILGIWGFCGALALMIISVCITKTVSGKSYLYPLIPFNRREFVSLFVKKPINKNNN